MATDRLKDKAAEPAAPANGSKPELPPKLFFDGPVEKALVAGVLALNREALVKQAEFQAAYATLLSSAAKRIGIEPPTDETLLRHYNFVEAGYAEHRGAQ